MKTNNVSPVLALVGALALAGCQSTNLGGDLGRDLGNYIGRDSGFQNSGYYGSKVGKWLEGEIFTALNARDQAELSVATQRAAETGKRETWGGDSGTHGTAAVSPTPSADGPVASNCRVVEQSATLPDGRSGTKQVQACKLPDGSWSIKPVG